MTGYPVPPVFISAAPLISHDFEDVFDYSPRAIFKYTFA